MAKVAEANKSKTPSLTLQSEHFLSSLHNLYLTSWHRNFLSNFILEWDPAKRSFFTYGSCHLKYRMWKLFMRSFFQFLLPLSCLLYILSPRLRPVKLKFDLVQVSIMTAFLPAIVYIGGLAHLLVEHVDDIVAAFRALKSTLERSSGSKNWKSLSWKKEIGMLTQFVTISGKVFPLMIPSAVILGQFDPLYSYHVYFSAYFRLESYIDPYGQFCMSLSVAFRLVLDIIATIESFRVFFFSFGVLLYWIEMEWRLLQLLGNCETPLFCQLYVQWQISSRMWEPCLSRWMSYMLGTLFVTIVFSNVICFRYFKHLELTTFWIFPVTSADCLVTVAVAFVFLVGVREESKKMVERRKVQKNAKKATRKRLEAFQAIQVKCGSTFVLDKEQKPKFFFAVVLRTAEVLLLY